MKLAARFRWFLAPSLLQARISFVSIPVATLWVGPADYGSFALVMAFSSLGCAISCYGTALLPAFLFDEPQKRFVNAINGVKNDAAGNMKQAVNVARLMESIQNMATCP